MNESSCLVKPRRSPALIVLFVFVIGCSADSLQPMSPSGSGQREAELDLSRYPPDLRDYLSELQRLVRKVQPRGRWGGVEPARS